MFNFWKKKKAPANELTPVKNESFQISEEIQDKIDQAFDIATKWLEEQNEVLFLFFPNEGKPTLAPIKDCTSQEDALERVRKWARKPDTQATWFVEMCTAIKGESDTTNALIAHCAERSQKEGFVLFQRLEQGPEGHLVPAGDIDFLKRIPNDYFA